MERTDPTAGTAAAHAAKTYTETLRRRGGDVVRTLVAQGVLTPADLDRALSEWFFAPIRRASSR